MPAGASLRPGAEPSRPKRRAPTYRATDNSSTSLNRTRQSSFLGRIKKLSGPELDIQVREQPGTALSARGRGLDL